MTALRSVSWDDAKKRRRRAGLVMAAALLALLATPARRGSEPGSSALRTVIVEAVPGALSQARDAVRRAGGTVSRELTGVDSLVVAIPADRVGVVRGDDSVRDVVVDGRVRLHRTDESAPADGSGDFDPKSDKGSMWRLTHAIGARALWAQGITGRGVDVALIDSGVVPVAGLDGSGKVVNGPDLSFESQSDALRYLDTYGHGTHMAGIIAGNDGGDATDSNSFMGVAPDARLLSIKVADADGATDVSQVLAAIDWVVQHRDDHGLHIRVLNLSFGTDGTQSDELDPLVHAVDVASRAGIVVVAAAGNRGGTSSGLDDPARSPHVLAVGADDTNGTASTSDDSIPAWSSSGDSTREPDLVAPGKSVVSLRVPASHIDQQHPDGRVAGNFFRGSGTSTSTAVVSGVVALLLQQRPNLTPDQVKEILTASARHVPDASRDRQGAGLVNARDAAFAAPLVPTFGRTDDRSVDGSGSLEAARGTVHVALDGQELAGEYDIFGTPWNGSVWAQLSAAESSWNGGTWNGNQWTGDDWSGSSWSGPAWAAATWAGTTWTGSSWSDHVWSGNSWSGNSWSGNAWCGNSWSGNSWSFLEEGP